MALGLGTEAIYIPLWIDSKVEQSEEQILYPRLIYIPLWIDSKESLILQAGMGVLDLHSTMDRFESRICESSEVCKPLFTFHYG